MDTMQRKVGAAFIKKMLLAQKQWQINANVIEHIFKELQTSYIKSNNNAGVNRLNTQERK